MNTLKRWDWLTLKRQFDNPVDTRIAQYLFLVNGLTLGIVVLFLIRQILGRLIAAEPIINLVEDGGLVIMVMCAVGVVFMLRYGYLPPAAVIFLLGLFVVFFPFIRLDSANDIVMVLPLMLAGVLFNRRGLGIALIVIVLVLLQRALNTAQITQTGVDWTPVINGTLGFALAAWLLSLFSLDIKRLAVVATDDLHRLHILNEIAELTQRDFALIEIVTNVLDNLMGMEDYDYAQLYIVDEQETVTQLIRTSSGISRYRVINIPQFSRASGVMECIQSQRLLIITPDDPDLRRSHFTAGSQFGMLLPLTHEKRLVGILDLQRSVYEPIIGEEIETLQPVLQSMAMTLVHLRRVEQLRDDLAEQQKIITRLRQQAGRTDSQEQIAGAWTDYLNDQRERVIGFDVDRESADMRPAYDLPDSLRESFTSGQVVTHRKTDDEQVVSIPIMLQGVVIGGMAFTVPGTVILTPRQLEMVQAIADRLALALENRRLYEQSQMQAQRESAANEAANILLGSTNVITVLETAANTFNEALNAINTQVYIDPDMIRRIDQTSQEETV